jgi:hypothetical protein
VLTAWCRLPDLALLLQLLVYSPTTDSMCWINRSQRWLVALEDVCQLLLDIQRNLLVDSITIKKECGV